MFTDEARIRVQAGKGGDGAIHFHREKFVPKGGPDGGDGGKGGDVVFLAVNNAHTLSDFRSKKLFKAENGTPGSKKNMTGKSGEDLIIKVPVGTIIREQIEGEGEGPILADLTRLDQKVRLAHGGIGGKGNAGFVNSVRQAPNFAEKGDAGESFDLDLELKLVADVALVGYPSVGKSTLISVVSNAKPKIAEYHFTTLVPNLGVVKLADRELIFVDVPGLIEGAADGKGLGHTFLKHIERARFVLHMIDADSPTPLKDFEVIQAELKKFSPKLADKDFMPVFTKIDVTDSEIEDFITDEFEAKFGIRPWKVSAATHEGLDGMLKMIFSQVPDLEEVEVFEDEADDTVQFRPEGRGENRNVKITKETNWWTMENPRLEQMVRQTDTDNAEAKERVYDVLRKWGALRNLETEGGLPGDKIMISGHFWEFRGL